MGLQFMGYHPLVFAAAEAIPGPMEPRIVRKGQTGIRTAAGQWQKPVARNTHQPLGREERALESNRPA